MYKTLAVAALLLAVLTLLTSGIAVAGPPEPTSGRMVLPRDEVSDALAKYQRESEPHRRLALLTDLARVRDPRVAVALGQALYDPRSEVRVQAAFGILFNQTGEEVKKMMRGQEAVSWARGGGPRTRTI